MAFGLMVKKWGILARPLTIKLKSVKTLMFAIAKLHNFCISERLLANRQTQVQHNQQIIFTPTNVAFTCHEAMLREESALEQFEEDFAEGYENAWSNNRERMVREIEALQLTRPGMSSRRQQRWASTS
jgi:hypothetical protein